MAVVAMWKCDRDDTMFDNKKEADAYDKMLELAESFTEFLSQKLEGISEQDAENIGLLLSRNKNALMAACKGNTELLLGTAAQSDQDATNITPLKTKAK